MLFNIFPNYYLSTGKESFLGISADNIILGSTASIMEDRSRIHKGLLELESWARADKMKFREE